MYELFASSFLHERRPLPLPDFISLSISLSSFFRQRFIPLSIFSNHPFSSLFYIAIFFSLCTPHRHRETLLTLLYLRLSAPVFSRTRASSFFCSLSLSLFYSLLLSLRVFSLPTLSLHRSPSFFISPENPARRARATETGRTLRAERANGRTAAGGEGTKERRERRKREKREKTKIGRPMREEARAKEKERESPERKDLTTSRQFLFTARLQYRGECGSCVCVCDDDEGAPAVAAHTRGGRRPTRRASVSLCFLVFHRRERESGIER